MDRREMLGFLGAGAAGLAAVGGTAKGFDDPAHPHYRTGLDKMHAECLDSCQDCAAVCNESSSHCLMELSKGGDHAAHHAHAHQLAMDCSTMCATSATLISRMSPLMAEQCAACAEACRRCAEACEKDPTKAAIMAECARICRECEKSCKEMASKHGKSVAR